MAWHKSQDAFIWIFNVGRGSAAFVRTPLNQGMIFDISCSKEFSTSDFILGNLCTSSATFGGLLNLKAWGDRDASADVFEPGQL